MALSTSFHNLIRNSLRAITKGCSVPQKRATKDLLLAIFREGTTIINHLANRKSKVRTSKQAERLCRHLGNIEISNTVEERIFRTLPEVKDDTVIAYDLGDIAKPCAKKMEGLHDVFDGSERKRSKGYTTHGVSIHNQPVIFEFHNHDTHTLNQTRLTTIDRLVNKIGTKGVYVFDRGNDDKQFFSALTKRTLKFIIRLRKNRHLLHIKTGVKSPAEDFLPGKYEVMVPDTKEQYLLVVHQTHPRLQPIRVLTNVEEESSVEEVVERYLERWDMENLYKQMKTKYNLEAIRLLSLRKLKNLTALIQLATSISNLSFEESQKEESTQSFTALAFKQYCYYRCLSPNRFAFTGFLSTITPKHSQHSKKQRHQLSLLSWRQVGKLGVF